MNTQKSHPLNRLSRDGFLCSVLTIIQQTEQEFLLKRGHR